MKVKNLTKKSGIYQIKNLTNGKIYVGSAVSLYNRYHVHVSLLKNNKHTNIHLQRAWNKYLEDSFEFFILEKCKKSELLVREQYYLNTLLNAEDYAKNNNKYFLKHGYNILPYSNSRLGSKQTKESIKKSVLNNPNRKEVMTFTLNGQYIDTHISIAETSRYYNISESAVYSCCIGDSKYSGNYLFIFKKDYEYKKDYIITLLKSPINKQVWNKNKKYTQREIYNSYNVNSIFIYNIFKKLIKTFNSQKECANYFNTGTSSISKIKNTYKLYNGYYVFDDTSYIFDEQLIDYNYILELNKNYDGIIYMYDYHNNFINTFKSIKECSLKTKLSYHGIQSVVSKQRKSYKYFKFVYREDIV